MNAIEMKHITKGFSGFSIQDLNFELPEGTICGLIGENGAGKSTTIRLIMNALQPDSGTISVLGTLNTSSDFQRIKEDIGVVLDEAYFPETLNAKQVGSIMKDTYGRWNPETYQSFLDRFELPLGKIFKDYSRGMKMKLAIAVALSHDPKLLILDEATSGLDPIVRDEILEIFSEFTRNEGHSILISSHIVSDLEKLCDYIAFIHKGKLKFCREKDDLQEQYGIVSCAKAQLDNLPKEAICGIESSPYGVRVLVQREKVSSGFQIERANLEDLIVFLVKGEKQA